MKKIIPISLTIAILACLFTGCKKVDLLAPQPQAPGTIDATMHTVNLDFVKTDADLFSNRDLEKGYDTAAAIQIQLNGSSAACSSPAVAITGSSITINKEGTYILSGTLNDGSITINAGEKDKIQLVLNNANLTSRSSPAVFAVEGDKLFITAAEGTNNTIANGGNFVNEETDAAILSRMDLTVNGSGKLDVKSPAGTGITCKDDLVVAISSMTLSAGNHGLEANDSIRIAETNLTITAGKDGIHAENNDDDALGFVYVSSGTFSIAASGDGISAGSTMQINEGNFTIKAKNNTDGSIKGIKSGSSLLLSAGVFSIESTDDAIHAGNVAITDGTYQISSGDDAIHADEILQISNGSIQVTKSYEGLEAHHVNVSGGKIQINCTDDGINAAGGNDSSGIQGGRDPMEPGNKPAPGGPGRPEGPGAPGAPGGPGAPGKAGDGSVTISGGTLNIISSGDGIDANGTLTITGGMTTVTGPAHGDTATLDFDVIGGIGGGTFIGTGGAGMAQTFNNSTQGVIYMNVGEQAAAAITLTDAEGNTILTHTPNLPFAVIIISTPDMVKGESYTIAIGGSSHTITAT